MDIRKLILTVCSPKEFCGKEAHYKLNEIAEKIHLKIQEFCKKFFKRTLLGLLYGNFDFSCRCVVDPNIRKNFANNIEFQRIHMSPSIFRYLIEVALCSSDNTAKKNIDKKSLESLIKSAAALLQICTYSDYLYYNSYNGGFRVLADGEIEFISNKRINKIKEQVKKHEKIIAKKVLQTIDSFKYENFIEKAIKPYDDAFDDKYGVKLSEVFEVIKAIINLMKIPQGVKLEYYKVLIKRIMKAKPNIPRSRIERAVRMFELDKAMLSNPSWKFYRFHNIYPSVSRQPIVHISGSSGKDGAVIFGPWALSRAFALLNLDLYRGVIELGKFTKKMIQESGVIFEDMVRETLKKYGFKVMHITSKKTGSVGDIDAIAFHEVFGDELWVLEAKSHKINLNLSRLQWHLDRSRKACKQLEKKVEWVKRNIDKIATEMEIPRIRFIRGIVVTEGVLFYDYSCPYDFLTLTELEYLIESKLCA